MYNFCEIKYIWNAGFSLLQEQTAGSNQNSATVTSDKPSVTVSITNGELSAQEWLIGDIMSHIVHNDYKKTIWNGTRASDSWVLVWISILAKPLPASYITNKYISPSHVWNKECSI
jgi:hypothetical protein